MPPDDELDQVPADDRLADAHDYHLAPVDVGDEAQIEAVRAERDRRPEPWPPPLPVWSDATDRRYTLAQLMLVSVCASVLMVGFRLLPAGSYALVLGLCLLVSRVVLDTQQIDNPLLHLAWWMLGLLYLIALVVAWGEG